MLNTLDSFINLAQNLSPVEKLKYQKKHVYQTDKP